MSASAEALLLLPDDGVELQPLDEAERIRVIVARWHNGEHPGAYQLCRRQPCYAIEAEL